MKELMKSILTKKSVRKNKQLNKAALSISATTLAWGGLEIATS